jgi:two-component system nitrate/nitrite sensor histidine kinase NarX
VIPIVNHDEAARCAIARARATRVLVSVPIRLQQRLIGEIDLFFRSAVTLRSDEVELLDALASHLASALEGACARLLWSARPL